MFTPVHESDDEATIDKEESDMEKVTPLFFSPSLSVKPLNEGHIECTSLRGVLYLEVIRKVSFVDRCPLFRGFFSEFHCTYFPLLAAGGRCGLQQ